MLTDKNGNVLSADVATGKIINRFFAYAQEFSLYLIRLAGFIPSHIIRKIIYELYGVSIGANSFIHMGAKFNEPWRVKIGEGTIIGENCFLDGRANLIIGNNVDIASDVMIWNSEHDVHSNDFSARSADILIGDYVFIGPRAIILPGVKIGQGAVVAAGAVVSKDVPDMMIVGGVPAKEIGMRRASELNYKLGRPRLFQ